MVSGIWVSHCMTIYFSWADVFLLNSTLWFNSCPCVTIVAKPPKTHCLEQIHTLPWIWGLEVTCLNKFTGLKLRFPQHCIVWRMWGKYISLPFTSIQSLSYLHYTLSSSPRAQLCWSFWFFFIFFSSLSSPSSSFPWPNFHHYMCSLDPDISDFLTKIYLYPLGQYKLTSLSPTP